MFDESVDSVEVNREYFQISRAIRGPIPRKGQGRVTFVHKDARLLWYPSNVTLMKLPPVEGCAAMKHFFSVPGSVSPLKICAAVIVIASLALVLFHAIPVGNRTRHLLSQIHDMNVLGLGLEGDLQSELGEGRGQFLRILLSSGEGGELDGEIATVRLKDKEIGLLRGKIVELGASPEQWQQFEDTWERYKSKRDAEIALVVQGKRAEALEADNATGRGAYQEVKESVKRARSAFELASNDRIEQAKKLLRETAVEVLLLLA